MKIETNSRKSITLDLTFFLLLISNYLSRKLDFLTGITISNAITHDKKAYGKLFEEVSNPRNKADLTLFVQNMYQLIIDGQTKVIEELQIAKAKLDNAINNLKQLDLKDKDMVEVLFVLIQGHLYNEVNEYITDIELRKHINISYPKLKQINQYLIAKKLIVQIKKKPSIHILSSEFQERLESFS